MRADRRRMSPIYDEAHAAWQAKRHYRHTVMQAHPVVLLSFLESVAFLLCIALIVLGVALFAGNVPGNP